MHIGLGPVKDLRQLIPIGDLMEWQMLDRRACDDQPVEFLVLHLGKSLIELFHMLGGGILGLMLGHPDQGQLNL